jgi:hypothetical protein
MVRFRVNLFQPEIKVIERTNSTGVFFWKSNTLKRIQKFGSLQVDVPQILEGGSGSRTCMFIAQYCSENLL